MFRNMVTAAMNRRPVKDYFYFSLPHFAHVQLEAYGHAAEMFASRDR